MRHHEARSRCEDSRNVVFGKQLIGPVEDMRTRRFQLIAGHPCNRCRQSVDVLSRGRVDVPREENAEPQVLETG